MNALGCTDRYSYGVIFIFGMVKPQKVSGLLTTLHFLPILSGAWRKLPTLSIL